MKVLQNVFTLSMALGLSITAGTLLFSAGSLTALGWIVGITVFAGATGHVALSVMNLIPEKADKPVNANEKDGIKPGAQAA